MNWIDPNNGWETATELVEDTQAIARYGRNVTKMDAFGCTSRGQAHRAGLWLIKTELLETQTVDFSVGAEGLRHVPGDVIEICDDDYAGIRTGGRVLAVNSQTRTLTLDREITLPSSGTTLISLVDGQGSPVSVEVQSVTDGVKVKVSRVPDGVAEYSVWGLKLPTLRQRLFRCVSIRENDDGTYAITAVQHVPEKEAIVDNGAHFDGDQSGTVNGVTPPAVQHLTAEVTADSGEYQVLARWDTPKVVKGVSFLLRLTVAADDGSERLVSTARTTETTYRFTQLALGRYTLTVRAVNAWGQQGDPASVSFRIAAPAAPSRIELTPGYFQITATPHLAVYDPTVQFEFWFSEKRIADIRQVETTARYLGTALYWIAASINIRPGHNYYFYVRSVNTVGKSAFVEAVGQPSDDASGYLDFFKGEIGKTHLAQELWTQIDNGQLAPDLAEIRTSITDVSNEITQTVNKKLEDQSAAIQQIQKVQVDTNNNLNSMWAVKLQQMQDGRLYIAGIGAGIENTPDGMQSQVLLAAFSVGAEGLRHVPGDVIEICDDDYAGIRTGGRVLAVNSQTRTLTLDREITLPSSGTTLISLVDGQGSPVSVEVQSVTDGVKVKVSRVPDGVAEYSVWGLKLPTLRQRLFRCVSIRENDDGTYAITAVQHVPEKEAIVDNGAHFDGDQSGTVNGVTPPAVQHLTAEVTADSGEYQVLARWDTPKVVKGVSFLLRLTVAADDGRERLVSTARTTETTYRFTQLALGNYRLTVRAVNAWGQQGDPASVSFRIAAPAAPVTIELIPGYFQITAVPKLAVYDPTVQFEFWFSEKRIIDIRQVETSARYLGTALYWIAASSNIKPGYDYYFYIRSVNTVGKSAFVEAVGRASDDAEGYLNFYKGLINKTHLGKELLENFELTEDNASKLEEFSKEWKDANDKWNAMWGVKIEQTKDGKHYVAGLGLSMEDTEEGKLSQFLVAANRIAFIDPANGNETPMFVAQGNQIFMNDVFLKRLTAPTITSGGNPPAFSLTPDGRLTAKNADISGNVNANSGTLNNVTINENCRVLGKLSANQIEGDLVKTVGKAFPRDSRAPERWPSGTITVRVYDDQPFDRQIVIPAVAFSGAKHEREHTDIYSSCRLIVRKNGAEIYNRTALDNTLIYSGVIDMPAGHGHMTLEFSVSAWLVNGWYPTASISDLLVVVMKKATAGITIS
ncbi:host specificity protein [Shigella sonnei]|nr:host specificity protein [Shigella sonnei]